MSNALPTITVGITREPGTHLPDGAAGGAHPHAWLGIHLGFDTALKDLENLLSQEWMFAVYELAGAALTLVPGMTVEEPFRDSPFDRSSPDATAREKALAAKALAQWLGKRDPTDDPPTDDPAAASEATVDVEAAKRIHLQYAAAGWDAPLPQWAGLTRLLKVSGSDALGDNTRTFYVVPCVSGETLPETVPVEEPSDGVLFKVQIGTGGSLQGTLHRIPLPMADRTQFLILPEDPSDARRCSDALAVHASTLVNSLAVYLDGGGDLGLKSPGLMLALDPIFVALLSATILSTEEGELAERDGYLLADLFRIYEKRLESHPRKPDNIPAAILEARTLVQGHIASITRKASDEAILGWLGIGKDSPLTLRDVAGRLNTEGGLEGVVIGILREMEVPGSPPHGVDAPSPLESAIGDYISLLQGGFNGVEAMRHEVGHVMQALMADTRPRNDRATSLRQEHYFKARLCGYDLGGAKKLAPIVTCLPKMIADPASFGVISEQAWRNAVDRMWPAENLTRFQPDATPQPLSIRIADTPQSDAGLDDYTVGFNGVGVLIKKGKWVESTWEWDPLVHASLVELKVPAIPPEGRRNQPAEDPPPLKTFPVAVHPFLPVAVDGRRQLDIDYRGYPLGSPAFGETDAADVSRATFDQDATPFSVADDVDYVKPGSPGAKPPTLAYGCCYRWAAYDVTKAGSLPTPLQAEAPWKPKTILDEADEMRIPADCFREETYRRRTAIGAVTFGMDKGGPNRIGKAYPDVEPLAIDRPRVSVSSTGCVDLFRGTNGKGQLAAKSTVVIDEIRCYGLTGDKPSLVIEVHDQATDDWAVVAPRPIEVVLDGKTREATIPIETRDSWLRVRLENGGSASASFALPTVRVDGSDHAAHGQAAQPAVILVADKGGAWAGEVTEEATVNCALSTVSYLDWEHWINNTTLEVHGKEFKEIGGAPDAMLLASLIGGLDVTGNIPRLVQRLPDPAVIGYVVELSVVDDVGGAVGGGKDGVIQQIKRTGARLCQALNEVRQPEESSLAGLCESLGEVQAANRLTFKVSCGKIFSLNPMSIADGSYQVSVPAGIIAKLAVRPIVDTALVAHGSVDAGAAIHCGLRQWAIGELEFRADDGKQVRGLVFEGAELVIEAVAATPTVGGDRTGAEMQGAGVYDALLESVKVDPGGPSRRYDLVLGSDFFDKPWGRLFSHVDVDTQRFRFSGRPIYHWYSPKRQGDSSVVWVDKPRDRTSTEADDTAAWSSFEKELFFDRDNIDCDTLRARIGVGGSVLQTLHWDNPSATWFRHGFTFQSRYRGLLRPGAKGGRMTPPRSAPWSRRAAVLADAGRLSLVRPQVRSHLPLSMAPDPAANPGATPPLACILEERPLAVGGLADRVLAEVALRPGYAFLGPVPGKLGPLDLGREIGRDPRLETWSWMPHQDPARPDEPLVDLTSSLVVVPEGPIGLHFERASSPAPAWPNCQYLLQPASLDGSVTVPDESFVGLRLSRVLDPAWVVQAGSASTKSALPQRMPRHAARWIEWGLDTLSDREQLLRLEDSGGRSHGICVCEARDGWVTLSIDRHLVDPQGGSGQLVLCRIPAPTGSGMSQNGAPVPWNFAKIVLMHSGPGDGRHVLSVLGIPAGAAHAGSDAIAAGRSNAPLVLASVSWTIPEDVGQAELCVGGSPCAVEPLLSSEPTFLEWARTARDAGTLHAVVDRASGQTGDSTGKNPARGISEWTRPYAMVRSTEPIPAKSLQAVSSKTGISFCTSSAGRKCWIVPPLAVSLQPLGIQRHLLGLFTRPTEEPGRRFERYVGARRLVGPNLSVPEDPKPTAVRIAEIEIPSVVVGSKLPVVMKLPPLDGDSCLRFHVRFANSPASLAGETSVKVKLSWRNPSDKPDLNVVFESIVGKEALHGVRALDATYRNDFWFSRWHVAPLSPDDAASQHRLEPPNPIPISGHLGADAIMVSLEAPSGTEVWADVSLLSSQLSDPCAFDAFDYDWLFTPERDKDDAPSERLDAATLSELMDTQARIVSISPQIDIHYGQ